MTIKSRSACTMNLTSWKKIFSVPGVHFINLQYGECEADLKEVKEKFGITIYDWPDADPLKDLENFAAEIAALDLVISIDNSTVYFSGAQNIPTWMLTIYDNCMVWGGFDDTPWFQSLKLFHQPSSEDWEPVIEQVAEELRRFVTTGTMPFIDPERSYKTTFSILEGDREE